MAMFIQYPWSGLTFDKASKSQDRTKKFPWKVCRLNPVYININKCMYKIYTKPSVHRILITASNPIFLVRYRLLKDKVIGVHAKLKGAWTWKQMHYVVSNVLK